MSLWLRATRSVHGGPVPTVEPKRDVKRGFVAQSHKGCFG